MSLTVNDDFKIPDAVIPEIKSDTPFSILTDLSQALSLVSGVENSLLLKTLCQRESLISTGIGNGLAIPNSRVGVIVRCYSVLGRSLPGVNFKAIDAQPAKLFFAFCSPVDKPELHLRFLALLSELLKDPFFRNNLVTAVNQEEIMLLFEMKKELMTS